MLSPDLLTQVRLYTEQMDAEAKSIDELLDVVLAGYTPEASEPAQRSRPGWVVAVAAAVAVFLIIGGVALGFRLLRSEAPVVDEPDPSPVETLSEFVVEDVPSFTATIEYGLDDPAAISGIIEVSYRRVDDGLRLDYVVESLAYIDEDSDPPIAGESYQPGDFLVWDNSQVATANALFDFDQLYQTTSGFTGLGALGWVTGWTDGCAPGSIEPLPAAVVAGITAVHIRCTTTDGVAELWIDEATGVVLAATGAVTIGPNGFPEGVSTEATGGYTMTTIEYLDEPAFDPGLFEVPDTELASGVERITVPGVHLVMRRMTAAEIIAEETQSEITEDSIRTLETWLVDDSRWREEVLDAQGTPLGGPWIPGSYTVQLDDQQLIYVADVDGFVIEEGATGPPFSMQEIGSSRVADDPICSQGADTTYLGRSVHQYVCDGTNLDPAERAAAQRLGVPEQFTYLIDEETGLVLYEQGPGFLREVLSIEFDVEFDEALFSVEPPAGAVNLYEDARPSGMLGQPAPGLTGTLLEGGAYDDSDWEGKRVALLFWASWCNTCVDALQAMQAASDQAGDDIVFVTVLTFDDPQEGRNSVEFIGATLPVVDDSEGLIVDRWQGFDWPWLILVDSTGTVIEVRGGGLSGYIANNLDDILNDAPW